MGEMKSASKILVREPQGKRPLGRTRCRWEDNIKRNLIKIGCGLDSAGSGEVLMDMDWVQKRGEFLE
jgi:hypothetical protein